MRKKITVLFLSALAAVTVTGCGGKKEEPKTTAGAEATAAETPETQAPKETVSENKAEADSGAEAVSNNQTVKKTKKNKNKNKKEDHQVTIAGAQETPSAAAQAEQARVRAQAQAEAQARAEEERLAAEAEQARLAEEEAQRLAAEAAITEQDIPQDTAVGSPQEDSKTTAQSYIGRTMDELIGAVGQPQGENRMPSCNGPGEDVEYTYPGFAVITYADETGVETIVSVE